MSLQALPSELLLQIARYSTTADDLRADRFARLFLFKHWYYVARMLLMEDVRVSVKNLDKFPPEVPEVRRMLWGCVGSVDIKLLYPFEEDPEDKSEGGGGSGEEEDLRHEEEKIIKKKQ